MRHFKLVIVVFGLVAVVVGIAVGLTIYLTIGKFTHPPEQTAKFLPQDTRLYFSVNLRPGTSQPSKLRKIFSRFEENESFREDIDDIIDQIDDESRVDLRNDVFPWLGPELSVAVLSFADSDAPLEIV